MKILCIGHSSVDLILRVDGFPREDTKSRATARSLSGGGPAANAAALLGYWDVSVAMAGPVGRDPFGSLLIEEFKAYRVDTGGVLPCEGYPTPVSAILVNDTSGSRSIINHRSTEDVYRLPENLLLCEPEVLLFDGHSLAAAREALERWPDAVSILDAGSLRGATWELVERVDYPVASAAFASAMLGEELAGPEQVFRALELLQRRNGNCAVITLGEKGGVWALGDRRGGYDAFTVKTVDTTAAGDIFHGAFAYGLLNSWDLDRILRFAACAAGISASKPGGRDSFPSLEEVLSKL
ncbi:PfkB family carbohydrate kinase [Marispirochaeta aestuarii]|uniref:carbohydrate kinase family protein n=1 Tax=Marispirochaeta aestuarii TaxID=1963862 RepID=UPI0029C893CE|nr:PfkB family carbohydrate kinase [Marispirochaeta aestuarii]